MTVPHRSTRGGRRAGFTLIELLIVIAIILAIGGLVLVNTLRASGRADTQLTQAQIQAFDRALEQFQVDMKRLPTQDEGIVVLWNKDLLEDDTEASKWAGPYLKKPSPTDQWGTEWIYRNPSEIEGIAYEIVSAGPDKEEDTDDDIGSADGLLDENGDAMDDFSDFSGSDS